MGPHGAPWVSYHGFHRLGCGVLTGAAMTTEERVRVIDRYTPSVLSGTPSYLLHLGAKMQEAGLDPAGSSVRLLSTGGEVGACVPETKARLEQLWGAQLGDHYGSTELGLVGYTCLDEMRQSTAPMSPHVMEDAVLVEIVDPETRQPIPDGELGAVVVTALHRTGTPMLRYFVGDYGRLTSEPCSCGRTDRRLVHGLQGRVGGSIKVRGISVTVGALEAVLRACDDVGSEYLAVVERPAELDVMRLIVEGRPGLAERESGEVKARLEQDFRTRLGVGVTVEVVAPNALQASEVKARRIEDRRLATP
jgi:phenylacetate-CoA ligase